MAWDGPKWDPQGLFRTNPDLADILGRTDLNFENFYSLFVGPRISGFPGPQISKLLDFQVPRFPDSQIPRFPDAAGGGAGEILRSQPDPSPNAPRDQIRRKKPLLRTIWQLEFKHWRFPFQVWDEISEIIFYPYS